MGKGQIQLCIKLGNLPGNPRADSLQFIEVIVLTVQPVGHIPGVAVADKRRDVQIGNQLAPDGRRQIS